MSQQIDASLTVGVNMEYQNAVSQFAVFKKKVEGEDFSISAAVPKDILNTEATTRALQGIKGELADIDKVTAKVKFFEVDGKKYKEVVELIGEGKNAAGQLATVNLDVASSFKEVDKATKAYASMATKATNAINSSTNMEDKHKTAIQGTANQILKTIDEWNGLSVAQQANSDRGRELQEKLRLLNIELDKNTGAAKTSANAMQGFGTRMANALKQSFAYGLSMRVMRAGMQQVGEAIRYVTELNKELINIQILQAEGAQTPEELNRLADGFNKLGQEMGVSTLEIAKGSVEWLRQGKTIAETQELLRSSIMLAKLGNMEVKDATEKLTSTLNGYNMVASDTVDIVSKLVAVDNVAATSVEELTTALQYSAAIANQTGVSLEQLVSYVATVSSTTRLNAESIGQGMKTMLTRMQDIRRNKIDEDGLGINNVEISLKKANVALRESDGSFRDFGDVLEELATKWETLNDVERAYISKSVAGVRQANMFTILMTEMGQALEYQQVQMDSSGLAVDRYAMYMEGLEAKQGQFKAALEDLYSGAVGSGTIGWFIDAGGAILKFIDSIGGIKAVLPPLIAGIVLLKKEAWGLNSIFQGIGESFNKKALKDATDAIVSLQEKLSLAKIAQTNAINELASAEAQIASGGQISNQVMGTLRTNVVNTKVAVDTLTASGEGLEKNLIVVQGQAAATGAALNLAFSLGLAAISILISVVTRIKEEQRQALDDAMEFKNTWNEIQKGDEGKKRVQSAKDLLKEYDKLSSIIRKTSEQEDRYKEIVEELSDLYPELSASIKTNLENTDLQTGTLEAQKGILQDILDLEEKRTLEKQLQNKEEILAQAQGAKKALKEQYKDVEAAFIKYAELKDKAEAPGATEEDKIAAEQQAKFLNQQIGAYNSLLDSYKEYYDFAKENKFDALFIENLDKYVVNELSFEDVALTLATALKAGIRLGLEESEYGYLFLGGTKPPQIEPTRGGYGDLEKYYYRTAEGAPPAEVAPASELQTKIDKQIELNTQLAATKAAIESINNLPFNVMSEEDRDRAIAQFEDIGKAFKETEDGTLELDTALLKENDTINDLFVSLTQLGYFTDDDAGWEDFIAELLRVEEKTGDVKSEIENLQDTFSNIANVMKDYSDGALLTAEQLYQLKSGAIDLTDAIYASGDGFAFSTDKAYDLAYSQLYTALTNNQLGDAAVYAGQGLFSYAMDAILAKTMTEDLRAELVNLLLEFQQIAQNRSGGGSGGGSGSRKENPAIKENEELIEQKEEQIDLYEDEKDALKKMQDEYNDFIDKQKESLQLAKDEADYFKEQKERTTDLAKLKKEIALLELDNTEEARAKRLQLEEEAANLEKEIAENTEERRYDLQMQALDNLKKAYDEMIAKQIEAIDLLIEGIRDEIEDLRKIIEDLREADRTNGSSGGGGGYNSNTGGGGGGGNGAETAVGGTIVSVGENSVFIPAGDIIQKPFNPNGTHYNQNSIDVASEYGSIIGSPVSGALLGSGMSSAYGGWAAIGSPENPYMVYHLDKESIDALTGLEGTMFEMGQKIGVSGNTGGINGIPHVGIMAGASWNQAEYDAAKANRMVNDTVAWAFKQPGKNDQIAKDLLAVAEYLDSGILEEAIGVGLNNVTKQIDISSSDNKDAITTDLEDGFISIDDAITNGLIKNGESIKTLQIATENGTKTLVYTFKDGFYGFGIMITKAIKKGESKKELVNKQFGSGTVDVSPPINKPGDVEAHPFHSGGIVDNPDKNTFSNGLKANEVFAKLLKGEVVANEAQIRRFLNDTMPTLTRGAVEYSRINSPSAINISMPINVEGNLDKSVMPDLDKLANAVLDKATKTILSRGYVRSAGVVVS